MLLAVAMPHAPVEASDAVGYRLHGSVVVGYDFANAVLFLENGARVTAAEVDELGPPDRCAAPVPALGTYAACWLGDCVVVSIGARRAIVRTTCAKYAVAMHMLQPVRHTDTVRGVRVLYGRDRCMVFPSLTFTGGAMALLSEIVAKMRLAGLTVHGQPRLLEQQTVRGTVAVALRRVASHSRMVLQLRATVEGEADPRGAFHDVAADVALAHVTIEDYLQGNPWALPISHELLCRRLGLPHTLDADLIFGSYQSYEGCLHLESPRRTFSHPVFEVDAGSLVQAVRSGRAEALCDGTYAMAYAHGGYGEVRARGPSLADLMWKLDDLFDACLPLWKHKVDVPGCPPVLLLERFGSDVYDVEAGTVTSAL